MASFMTYTTLISVVTLFSALSTSAVSDELATTRIEKVSHLHFYFHDILGGKTPTAVQVAGRTKGRSFGDTMMADDPLTEGPHRGSKLVGRAQGLWAMAAQEEPALLMVMNFAFMAGKYNGSSISVVGRNPLMHEVREIPILGGSGLFRYARGYALAHTVWHDAKTGDAIVEYNVSVLHY